MHTFKYPELFKHTSILLLITFEDEEIELDVEIQRELSELYRNRKDLQAAFSDPYDATTFGSFLPKKFFKTHPDLPPRGGPALG